MIAKAAVLTMACVFSVAGIVLWLRPDFTKRRAGRTDAGYLTSRDCVSCHGDHYASWARTYHSRMTQEATPATVQGDFEHANTFDYLGIKALMERRKDRFVMTLISPEGARREFPIERTVGSRRIEQYLTKEPGHYERLPLAYDLVNR